MLRASDAWSNFAVREAAQLFACATQRPHSGTTLLYGSSRAKRTSTAAIHIFLGLLTLLHCSISVPGWGPQIINNEVEDISACEDSDDVSYTLESVRSSNFMYSDRSQCGYMATVLLSKGAAVHS